MARTQQQRREEMRARLLDAAIATIVEVGYARASAAVIARRAEVSDGALFKHFATMGDFMAATGPCFLLRNFNTQLQADRIVSLNFRTDSVFEGSDDFAASRIVLRVCRKHQNHIQRKPDRVSLNLDIALLHDVEQTYLDLACEVRELIDRKNPPVRSR